MLCNFTLDVWNKGPSTKVNGVVIPGILAYVKTIDCDLQPYSTALLLKNYGYNIEVTKRIFIDHFDADVKVGTVFKYKDGYGQDSNLLVKAIPWMDEYMDISLLEVAL